MNNEQNFTKEAADWIHGHLVGITSARTEDPSMETTLDVNNDTMLDAYNDAFNSECYNLRKDAIEVPRD